MNKPNFPSDIPCQCYPGRVHECVCPEQERALRAYAARSPLLKPMSDEQRAWCYSKLDEVEGYDWWEVSDAPDGIVAATVLEAWADYARDKGLL